MESHSDQHLIEQLSEDLASSDQAVRLSAIATIARFGTSARALGVLKLLIDASARVRAVARRGYERLKARIQKSIWEGMNILRPTSAATADLAYLSFPLHPAAARPVWVPSGASRGAGDVIGPRDGRPQKDTSGKGKRCSTLSAMRRHARSS